jgi:hypothetical protein
VCDGSEREEEDVAGEPEGEAWDDAVVDADKEPPAVPLRMRDWRDVERYREMKELKDLVDDDSGIAEIFAPPPRPIPAAKGKARLAAAVKPAPAAKPGAAAAKVGAKPAAQKPVPEKPAAHKTVAHKPAPHKAAAHKTHAHAAAHHRGHARRHHAKPHRSKVKAKRHR